MKKRMAVILIACAALVAASPTVVRADIDFSANIQINSPNDFYQPLEPYGSWVEVSSYGRCWHPREVPPDWQPYTQGHWEWTDAGWYWVSDEPWGWACFHYGSWYDDPAYGWVWIPGTEWASAWVSWRYSDDYIGWAPCGPSLTVLAPSFFTFCDVHRFRDHFHNRRDFVVNNTTIINRTRVINDFHRQSIDFDGRQRNVFVNRGPGVDPIRRATGRDLTPRPVREVVRETRAPENLRRDEGQRRDQRPEQRPAEQPRRETPAPTGRENQRNYQQPDNRQPRRDQTPSIYQTPQQQRENRDRTRQFQERNQPESRNPQTPERRPEATPPTGRDQQRIYREPSRPEAPTPAPQQRREVQPQQQRSMTPAERTPAERPLPPTSRDNVRPPQPEHREAAPTRQPQEVPRPAPEQRREVPAPQTPAERPLPPTGRDEMRPAHPEHPAPPVQAPAARPAPPMREVPPTAPGRIPDDGRGRDGRDRNNP
jgi:hypothetical protein